MDSGYTIVGLNEGWTLGGAKLMEWTSGFVTAMVLSELLHVNLATSGPLMIMAVLGTTFTLASVRRQFPDEERGLRNAVMVGLGFEPPGIPTPSALRPYWSGAPVRALPEGSYFSSLNLAELFDKDRPQSEDVGSIFLKRRARAEARDTGSNDTNSDDTNSSQSENEQSEG